MEYVTLRNSDLKVSRLCVGGCPLGEYGWGQVNEDELINSIKESINRGITFFDTADTYGLGKSEELLGKAVNGSRNSVIIATKFGVRVENGNTFYDNSRQWIINALENSLKRLDTEYIDLYQIHYRDKRVKIEEVISTLEDLKRKGYIRYYGLSNIQSNDIEELKKHKNKFVSFQNEYSLACRTLEQDIVKIKKELNLTPLTWGSLGQGVLTGKYDENVKFGTNDRRSRSAYINFHGEKLRKNLEIVNVLKEISQEEQKPVAAVALRWILDKLEDSVVLTGVKRPEQVNVNLEALEWELSNEQFCKLDEISQN